MMLGNILMAVLMSFFLLHAGEMLWSRFGAHWLHSKQTSRLYYRCSRSRKGSAEDLCSGIYLQHITIYIRINVCRTSKVFLELNFTQCIL